ncbi:hypothetical protein ACIPYQ_40365 [Streptomyces sp. NPDC090045]|uniref:hypothetical protein n=1 Tax=Streptomyces sp. NPDC090045 TaxID=3365927 RepID=UPI00381B25A1
MTDQNGLTAAAAGQRGPTARATRATVKVVRFGDLLYVTVFALVLEELFRVADPADVAGPLFGATAAVAALLVPAAALVRDHALAFQSAVVQRVIAPRDGPTWEEREERRKVHLMMLDDLKRVQDPLLRGFAYTLIAVPCAALALVRPHGALWHWWSGWPSADRPVTLETSLVGISLALLVSAVWSFYPVTWVMLRERHLDTLRIALANPIPPPEGAGQGEADIENQEGEAGPRGDA